MKSKLEQDRQDLLYFHNECIENIVTLEKMKLNVSNSNYGYQASFFDTIEECKISTTIYTTYINKIISYYKCQLERCESEIEIFDK